jgi:hypothetical protein
MTPDKLISHEFSGSFSLPGARKLSSVDAVVAPVG